MQIILLSENSEGLSIANKLTSEGHTVNCFIKGNGLSGSGLINLIPSWRPLVGKSNLVIASKPGFNSIYTLLTQWSIPTIGFTSPFEAVQDQYLTGWFNGSDWIKPLFKVWKYKELLTGGLGPRTECMGVVTRPTSETLDELIPMLRKEGFTGPVNGFDYDFIEAFMEGLREPMTDLIFETVQGIKKEINVSKDWLIAVRLTVPRSSINTEIKGLTKENLKHLYLVDVRKEDDKYFCSGETVLKATARGRTPEEARKRVYRTLDNLKIQNKQYRLDIGEGISSYEH